MKIETSKSVLKVCGVIDMIYGILEILLGVMTTAGGGLISAGSLQGASRICLCRDQPCAHRHQPGRIPRQWRVPGFCNRGRSPQWPARRCSIHHAQGSNPRICPCSCRIITPLSTKNPPKILGSVPKKDGAVFISIITQGTSKIR